MHTMQFLHTVSFDGKDHTFRIYTAFGEHGCVSWIDRVPDKIFKGPLSVELLDHLRAYCLEHLHSEESGNMNATEEYRGNPENVDGNAVQRNIAVDS